MASSAGKRKGKRDKGVDVCESSTREVGVPSTANDAALSIPSVSACPETSSADQLATSSRPTRPDPYETWPDPNSSPYINWDPIQLEQSGFPFKDRRWICLCCFKGFQQRFSTQALLTEHIRRDHAVLQEFWKKGCFWDLKNCSTCGNLHLSLIFFALLKF